MQPQVKIGVVGAGFMGQTHTACYGMMPDARVVGVSDVRVEQARQVAAGSGATVYASLADMLDAGGVDAVDICLPTDQHAQAAGAVLERGIHCVVEKPLALTLDEGRRMAELARGGKSVFMVANVIRFWPEYEFLNECVETGMLGKLEALSFTRVSPRPAWGWKGWSTDAKRSGGALLDLHIHDTDLILHLLGEPAAVDSCGVKIRGAWDYVTTNYHYQHAAVSALGGWNLPDSASFKMAYRAIFENGVLDYDITREPTVMVYRQGKKPEAPAVRRPRIAPRAGIGNISAMEGYYNELRYFVDCVRDGVPADRSNVASALLTLEWIYREMESAARKLR